MRLENVLKITTCITLINRYIQLGVSLSLPSFYYWKSEILFWADDMAAFVYFAFVTCTPGQTSCKLVKIAMILDCSNLGLNCVPVL